MKGSDSKRALGFLLWSAFNRTHHFGLSVVSLACAPKQPGFGSFDGGTFLGRVTEADACLLRQVLVALDLIQELKVPYMIRLGIGVTLVNMQCVEPLGTSSHLRIYSLIH